MTWIIQSTNLNPESGDKLFDALARSGTKFHDVGVIPHTTEITGLEAIDFDGPPLFWYGSTKLVRLVPELNLTPGVFFDASTFNTYAWNDHLGHNMLNLKNFYASVSKFMSAIGPHAPYDMFVRPVMDLKMFTGHVIEEGQPMIEWYEKTFNRRHINSDALLSVSPPQKIHGEWRFFIVDRVVVTGSQYRKDNAMVRLPDDQIPEEIVSTARSIALQWLPHRNCVMDIAMTDDGPKVIEFNCINASGVYNADLDKLVAAINTMMKNY